MAAYKNGQGMNVIVSIIIKMSFVAHVRGVYMIITDDTSFSR